MTESTLDSRDDEDQRGAFFDVTAIQHLSVIDLQTRLQGAGWDKPEPPTRAKMLLALLRGHAASGRSIVGGGILEILPDGFGFLRNPSKDLVPDVDDFYVSPSQVQRCSLRTGDMVRGTLRPPRGHEANFAMLKIHDVEGTVPHKAGERLLFEELTARSPHEPLRLGKAGGKDLREFNRRHGLLLGQRMLLRGDAEQVTHLAQGIQRAATKSSAIRTLTLVLDHRPEAGAHYRDGGEFVVVCDDMTTPESQTRAMRLVLERAKRLVERGSHVLLVIDALDAYVRALEATSSTNRQHAIATAKCVLASARATEGGGSLTTVCALRTEYPSFDALRPSLDHEVVV
ncbi:MAG: hypothetical protein H6832_04370 [Planctomycetes bacterium]|nr:hypothetical protein [Planctomycetota bacterium]MCB9890375.1 hypothetical protein [Planctomycetota bacterium]MCB9917617.1 hypothetical protein [Planctomycetota bacterium]